MKSETKNEKARPKQGSRTRPEAGAHAARKKSTKASDSEEIPPPPGSNIEPTPTTTEETAIDTKVEKPRDRNNREAREATARRHAKFNQWLEENGPAETNPPRPNPLFQLREERRAKLFVWLRECPYEDAVQQMLADQGVPNVTSKELNEFFQNEAQNHWEHRIARAAIEANALVSLVEENPVRFSSGILAALGQEAFRQIASGQVDPQAMTRMANLFLKARGDERAEPDARAEERKNAA